MCKVVPNPRPSNPPPQGPLLDLCGAAKPLCPGDIQGTSYITFKKKCCIRMNRFHRHRRLNMPSQSVFCWLKSKDAKIANTVRAMPQHFQPLSVSVSLKLFFKHPHPKRIIPPKNFPHLFFPTLIYSATLYYIQRTLQTLSFEVTLTFRAWEAVAALQTT